MAKHRLKSGSHSRIVDGVRQKWEAGDEIEPTKQELESFPDKFQYLGASVKVSKMSAGKVIELVEKGEMSAEEALAQEEAKKRPRKSLVESLKGLLESDED